MMSGTMSASMVINNILVAASEFIIPDRMEQLKLILYMNLCDYTFIKNEDSTALIKSDDDTFEILHDWQNQLIIDGKTRSTIKQYGYEIKNLLLYAGTGIRDIREKHVIGYLTRGKVQKKWKDKTYNSKVRSLRAFFKWAYEYDIITDDPMKRIKETKEEYRMGSILTPEQREIFRCCCKNERELALVDLLYSSGGRVSEIVQLNRDSIDLSNRRVNIVGKGRKEREIRFSAQAKVHIEGYLRSRKDDSQALFVSQKAPHNRLSDDGVRYILKTIQSRDVRLKGLQISPHTFRRTCGTDMINRGAPAEMVQKKLGHTKVDTTLQCYAKISQEAARDAERRYGVAG